MNKLKETNTLLSLCFIKSQDSGVYQKSPNKNTLFPAVNTYSIQQYKSLNDLYSALKVLLKKPSYCHISGFPTTELLNQTEKVSNLKELYIPRSNRLFSLFNEDTSSCYKQNLIVLDIDIKPGKKDITAELSDKYVTAYNDQEITEEIYNKEVITFINRMFPIKDISTYSIIIRKSSTFGLSALPMLSAHAYIQLDKPVPIDTIKYFISSFDFVDSAYYASGNSLLYTSVPNFLPGEDPLDGTHITPKKLSRLYYQEGRLFPSKVLKEYTPLVINKENKISIRDFDSYELPGYLGAVNRSSTKEDSPFYIPKKLFDLGYIYQTGNTNTQRYTSPNASDPKNTGGLLYFPQSGFLYDTHANSPISNLFGPKKCIHPYQLFHKLNKDQGTLKGFSSIVKKIAHEDVVLLELEINKIKSLTSWIPSTSSDELEHQQYLNIIETIVIEIYHTALPYQQKVSLLTYLTTINYKPYKGGKKHNKTSLKELWKTIVKDTAIQYKDFSPQCAERYNAELYLEHVPIEIDENSGFIVIPGYSTGYSEIVKLDRKTDEIANLCIKESLTYVLQDSDLWKRAIVKNITSEIMDIIKIRPKQPNYKGPKINKSLYVFKDSREKALNFDTKQVENLTSKSFTIYTLPFTYQEYNSLKGIKIEDTYFYKALSDTYRNNLYRIELVRDCYSSMLMSKKTNGIIYSFYGEPRSMKSILMLVLRKLVSNDYIYSKELDQMASNFAYGGYTEYHQGIIITEFNKNTTSQSNMNKVANKLLTITGSDGIVIEKKGIDSYWLDVNPCVITVGNEPPQIINKAWHDRQIAIKHDISFASTSHQQSSKFKKEILSNLVTPFLWAMDNPRIKDKILIPIDNAEAKQDKDSLLRDIDLIRYLMMEYLIEDDTFIIPKLELCFILGKLAFNEVEYYPEEFSEEKFTLPVIKRYFPLIKKVNKINNLIIEASKTRVNLDDVGRIGIKGLQWRNFNKISKILYDFSPE